MTDKKKLNIEFFKKESKYNLKEDYAKLEVLVSSLTTAQRNNVVEINKLRKENTELKEKLALKEKDGER